MHLVVFVFTLVAGAVNAQNLAVNGDFDAAGTSQIQSSPWTLSPSLLTTIGLEDGRSGNAALLQCQTTDGECRISQNVLNQASTIYTLSFYAKQTQSGNADPSAAFYVGLGTERVPFDIGVITVDWKQFSAKLSSPQANAQVYIAGFGACGAFAIDDVSLNGGSGSGGGTVSGDTASCSSSSSSNATSSHFTRFLLLDDPECASSAASSSGGDNDGKGSATSQATVSLFLIPALTLLWGAEVVF